MAPEVFNKGSYSESADIWSFGIVMGELATRKLPYDGIGLWESIELIRKGSIPPIPNQTPPKFGEIRLACLRIVPTERLNANQLSTSLQLLFEALQTQQQQPQQVDGENNTQTETGNSKQNEEMK